ncbi:MAG: hypothetical protein K2L87_07070 [Clostridiales bacterium]|nr:hypothetical protein [Clostridiales bacterium]
MLDFLPPRMLNAVRHLNLNTLYELRIRADQPLRANIGGRYVYLGEDGAKLLAGNAIIPTREEVEETLFSASGYSLHAVEEQLKQGFVTGKNGERIGIAGTFVYDKGGVLSLHSPTSLCVRIPHAVIGCAEEVYTRCMGDGLRSVLLMSPPGEGKTTLLRDLTRTVSERTHKNILVADERGELSSGDLGDTADVMRFADKLTAFTAGIRAMRPDVIVTDELLPEDYPAVRRAVESGITVFASAHLTEYSAVPEKLFERYVLLNGLGTIGAILGEDGKDVA